MKIHKGNLLILKNNRDPVDNMLDSLHIKNKPLGKVDGVNKYLIQYTQAQLVELKEILKKEDIDFMIKDLSVRRTINKPVRPGDTIVLTQD